MFCFSAEIRSTSNGHPAYWICSTSDDCQHTKFTKKQLSFLPNSAACYTVAFMRLILEGKDCTSGTRFDGGVQWSVCWETLTQFTWLSYRIRNIRYSGRCKTHWNSIRKSTTVRQQPKLQSCKRIILILHIYTYIFRRWLNQADCHLFPYLARVTCRSCRNDELGKVWPGKSFQIYLWII